MSCKTAKQLDRCQIVVLIVAAFSRENEVQETTYLTTLELASRIKYDVRTIRERLKDSVLLEGIHYIRPFGGRKILFVWETICRDIGAQAGIARTAIPMANGGVLHG